MFSNSLMYDTQNEPFHCLHYKNARVTLNTESDTVCLFPMASKLAGSNVTNGPPKRWDPWGGLYVVFSLIKVFK